MSRFGHKETLHYWAGIKSHLDYNIMPGIQTEIFGRKDFFNDFFTSTTYIWNEHVENKMTKSPDYYHSGACPFVYADAFMPRMERQGVGIFLPKHDTSTLINCNGFCYENIIDIIKSARDEPVFAIAPAGVIDEWKQVFKSRDIDIKVISVSYHIDDPLWQFGTAAMMSTFRVFYFPLFTTPVLCAYYSGAIVNYYDPGNAYESISAESIVSSHANLSNVYGEIENLWINNIENVDVIKSLIKLFLCPHKRQSQQDLKESLYMLNFQSNRLTHNRKRMIEDWDEANKYRRIDVRNVPLPMNDREWAEYKLEKKCETYDNMEYHPEVAKLIPLL